MPDIEAIKIKTFPLRMDEHFDSQINDALKKSTLKTKHDFIIRAVVEKIERERAV